MLRSVLKCDSRCVAFANRNVNTITQQRASPQQQRQLWSSLQDVYRTITGRKEAESMQRSRERKDLTISLVSLIHKRLRAEHPEVPPGKLIDQAMDEVLNKRRFWSRFRSTAMTNELSSVLQLDIIDVFEIFDRIDRKHHGEADDDRGPTFNDHRYHEHMIAQEKEKTSSMLQSLKNSQESKAFLEKKLGAIKTLESHHGWSDEKVVDPWENVDDSVEELDLLSDDFGYIGKSSSIEVKDAMRQYQVFNMCRAAEVRNSYGYSLTALKSTLPGAGRGVFVDGKAPAGSLVGFFPGEVWPREHLADITPKMVRHFNDNPNFLLSFRGDETIVDSRSSPYTVLDKDRSNAWAIAHIVNHPPKGVFPNCRTIPINFFETKDPNESRLMERYIPNVYSRKPKYFGPKMFDQYTIIMHGMGLMAARDIEDEELFYDYKLSDPADGSFPEWYAPVDEQEWEGGKDDERY